MNFIMLQNSEQVTVYRRIEAFRSMYSLELGNCDDYGIDSYSLELGSCDDYGIDSYSLELGSCDDYGIDLVNNLYKSN